MRNFRLILIIIALAVLSSCEQKPLYPKKHKESSENKSKTDSSDVGISDAADYATGALPLKVLKDTEKKIDDIQDKREKQIEKLKKD